MEHRLQSAQASVVAAPGLQRVASVAVPQAQFLRGMWDLPRPGIKLVSPNHCSLHCKGDYCPLDHQGSLNLLCLSFPICEARDFTQDGLEHIYCFKYLIMKNIKHIQMQKDSYKESQVSTTINSTLWAIAPFSRISKSLISYKFSQRKQAPKIRGHVLI